MSKEGEQKWNEYPPKKSKKQKTQHKKNYYFTKMKEKILIIGEKDINRNLFDERKHSIEYTNELICQFFW